MAYAGSLRTRYYVNSYSVRVCDQAWFFSILLEKCWVFDTTRSHFRMTSSVFQENNELRRKKMKWSILMSIFVKMVNIYTKNASISCFILLLFFEFL